VADIIPEIERVVLMRDGRVITDGCKEQVLTADQLSALFGLPVEISKHNGHYHLW
jgi:iron complex transport system ATP-binding protein